MLWRPGAGGGKDLTQLAQSDELTPEQWEFSESGVNFQARRDQGHNYGLFLDQRENRAFLKSHCAGKSILNLFSFTCGFSVCAALGDASEVVSVDIYQKYLDWGKQNFNLNNLRSENFSFYPWEATKYLAWASKKNKRFDWVICDPPSFSRSKGSGVFRVEKDFGPLVEQAFSVLNPGGTLWFSTNFEKWSVDQWRRKLNELGLGPVSPVSGGIKGMPHRKPLSPFAQRMKLFQLQK